MPTDRSVHPPRQTTARTEHDPSLTPEVNFERFLRAFKDNDNGFSPLPEPIFDRSRSLAPKNTPFTFSLRITRTAHIRIIDRQSTAFTLSRSSRCEASRFVELLFVQKGSVSLTLPDQTCKLSKGALILTDPAIPSTFVSPENSQTLLITMPAPYFLAHTSQWAAGCLNQPLQTSAAEGRLFKHLLMLVNESLNQIDPRDADNLCDGILCFLRPVLCAHRRSRMSAETVSGRAKLRALAADAMQKFLARPGIRAADIAAYCGISVRYLNELYRETGTTPMEALCALRLDTAAVWLREPHTSDLPIGVIAKDVGFRTAAHFSRRFRERFGVSPLAFALGKTTHADSDK